MKTKKKRFEKVIEYKHKFDWSLFSVSLVFLVLTFLNAYLLSHFWESDFVFWVCLFNILFFSLIGTVFFASSLSEGKKVYWEELKDD